MVEMVYRQENKDADGKEGSLKLPKNIKQIGDGEGDIQIYMEDNVALYLARIPDKAYDIRYGVLMGSVKKSCGYTYIFISGAADVREVFDNTVLFSDDIWTGLNDDILRYFPELKVVGWFLSQNGANANQNMWIKKMHLNNFAGMDKVFYKIDREEMEEAFYCYGREQLERMSCYHIYYEKNPQMIRYIEESGADIHFSRSGYGETKSGVINRAAEKSAEKIKNEINNKTNNKTENAQDLDTQKIVKINAGLKKAASFIVISGLAVTAFYMGINGRLDNLADGFSDIVSNIMNDSDEMTGASVISVNGIPSGDNENEITTLSDADKNADDAAEVPSEEVTEISETPSEAPTEAATEAVTGAPSESETSYSDGQTLSADAQAQESYTVQQGDTLYSICMKLYGSTSNMDTIIELNNLTSADEIYYGKNLIVP